MSAPSAPPRGRRAAALLRDPLAAFVAFIVLLFALDARAPRDDGRSIVIDRAMQAAMADHETALLGRPPTREELGLLVDAAVDRMVLAREARALGLDAGDPQIVGSLLDAMARRHAGDLPEPAEAEVAARFEADPDLWGGRPLAAVRQHIRSEILFERTRQRLAAVADAARPRYRIVLPAEAP